MPPITKTEARRTGRPTSGLQTILISNNFGTLVEMKAWLKNHKYKYGRHRRTTNFFRFIQNLPIIGAKYFTQVLPNGIELVYMR